MTLNQRSLPSCDGVKGDASGGPIFQLAILFALFLSIVQFGFASHLAFTSEDYTHMSAAASWSSWTDAFRLDLIPLRPLQHLSMYFQVHVFDANRTLSRLPAALLHFSSCLLVAGIARQLGLSKRSAAIALLSYAFFPNFKNLAWTAGIGWPGRQVAVLFGIFAYVTFLQNSSVKWGVATLIAFLVALGFHQGAFVFPAFLLGIGIALNRAGDQVIFGGDKREGAASRSRGALLSDVRASLTWPVVVSALLAAGYLAYIVFLRENRHTEVRDFSALPANLIKGTLSLTPEWFRVFVVEGLRAGGGALALAAIAAAMVGIATLALFFRSDRIGRVLAALVALELIIPILTVGYVQRYAYLASAMLALWLATWHHRRSKAAFAVIAFLIANWSYDLFRDIAEYCGASTITNAVVVVLSEAVDQAPADVQIHAIDAPTAWGSERDIPLFNWGLVKAVNMHRAGRVVPDGDPLPATKLFVERSHVSFSNFTNGDMPVIGKDRIVQMETDPKIWVFRFDPSTGSLLP